MKQYDEREFTLITHGDMETYQWLIKENIKRNRRNGIVFNIVVYTFVSVISIVAIFMVTKDIFFENYPINFFGREQIIKSQDQKINKINQQIEMDDDYGSLETPTINTKVQELESRVDDFESN
ncbi:hypothetical protein [Chryseobacterium sp. Bi04]|uniref:hypothetical protein n=1 Tax=Chryseobacterium sp. Bi04 TaxID=2822345 RepID=UPI001D41D4EA|nr:hypothetical protein [Chryseobacterium sp. Bi04]CAH0297472.1 hypothetical protein SRABI04_04540 [Chryseobacterium sp. Bi04]